MQGATSAGTSIFKKKEGLIEETLMIKRSINYCYVCSN